MDHNQLTTFDRIVREGSFSRAARELHIAQPTISARIHALEEEVGGALLTRTNHGVQLTALGVSFLPYARQALAAMLEGIEAARQARSGLRGRITIGSLGSLTGGLLAPALVRFQATHPTVECYARSADHLPLVRLLYDGVVELAVIAWPCVQPLVTDLKPLLQFHEPVLFTVPRRHPFAQRTAITQADIIECDTQFLLLRWWQITHPEVARLAARAKFMADVPQEVALYLVREGHAFGFFTHAYIHRELKQGEVVQVPVTDMPMIYRDSALVRLERSAELAPAANALIRCLQEQAAQMGILADERG